MDNRIATIVAGGLAIAIGLQLLGEQAGWWQDGALWRFWPIVLIGLGLRRGVTTGSGLLWTGYGVLLLCWTTGLWPIRESWPLLLVLYGVVLLRGRACGGARARTGRKTLHAG